MQLINFRNIHYVIATLSFAGLFIALISQHFADMRPCAWCVFQRLILILLGLSALLTALLYKTKSLKKIMSMVSAALCAGGFMAAWYQFSVAAQQFSCDQTFADKFISSSGLDATLPWLFGIYATCMDARVELFGIEYALWAGALFVFLLALNLLALKRLKVS